MSVVATEPTFTDHARERLVEMGLTTKDVKRAFRLKVIDYPSLKKQHRGCRVFVSGDLAIPYKIGTDGRPVVLTVLWNSKEGR